MHRTRLALRRAQLLALSLAFSLGLAPLGCKRKPLEGDHPQDNLQKANLQKTGDADDAAEIVYAGSAHLRVVDSALGKVVAALQLQRAINDIEFSANGHWAFVAASDGVHRIRADVHQAVDRLTERPARGLVLDDGGTRLFVLEHEVKIADDGTRESSPFSLTTIDVESGKRIASEEVGLRVLYALPSLSPELHHLVVTERGEVRLGLSTVKLAEGNPIDVLSGLPSKTAPVVRPFVARFGRHAYVPVEAAPSRILDIDLASGEASSIPLERSIAIRGLAVHPAGRGLVVTAMQEALFIDLETRAVRATVELGGAHQGMEISSDGRWAFAAETVDGSGGSITRLSLPPSAPFALRRRIHLDDISPWVLAVRPRTR